MDTKPSGFPFLSGDGDEKQKKLVSGMEPVLKKPTQKHGIKEHCVESTTCLCEVQVLSLKNRNVCFILQLSWGTK